MQFLLVSSEEMWEKVSISKDRKWKSCGFFFMSWVEILLYEKIKFYLLSFYYTQQLTLKLSISKITTLVCGKRGKRIVGKQISMCCVFSSNWKFREKRKREFTEITDIQEEIQDTALVV